MPTPPGPGSTARIKTIPDGPYVAGRSYFGRNGYIEYVPGTIPVIITAPHGGRLRPTEVPDRVGGVRTTDTNTDLLATAVADAFEARTGKRPHVVITHLDRDKIDTNRDSAEATEGNANAVTAWFEFHDFIEVARQAVIAGSPSGFHIDLHGHGHAIARLELGYLLTAADLDKSDQTLDATTAYERKASIRGVSELSPLSFSQLLRGPASLGALFAAEGFPTVPSPTSPSPGTDPYFNGGYNTARYGCSAGGPICGVQIESHFTGVRDIAANRARFAAALAVVIEQYLRDQAGIRIAP